jgi:hypothetical protein
MAFYNRNEKFLLRGTDWFFKQSSLIFVFKGLKILTASMQSPLSGPFRSDFLIKFCTNISGE